MQLKYPNKPGLRSIGPNLFRKYSDVLLGEHVAGLKAKNSRGEVASTPSLGLVLSLPECQVRKLMVKLMNEGEDMPDALRAAMKDSTTKGRYFLTPVALDAATERGEGPSRKSRSPRREGPRERSSYGWSRPAKGKQGGKSKGKGAVADSRPAPQTGATYVSPGATETNAAASSADVCAVAKAALATIQLTAARRQGGRGTRILRGHGQTTSDRWHQGILHPWAKQRQR